MSAVSFIPIAKSPGSNMKTINIDLFGRPFGQIWTFSERHSKDMIHVKLLGGEVNHFHTMLEAKKFVVESSKNV